VVPGGFIATRRVYRRGVHGERPALTANSSGPSDGQGGKGDRAARLKAALKHPLAITALGALAASLLIPAFTNQWQDRQKERDLKTELATSLDELTTRAVIAARIVIDRRFREAQTTDAREEDLDAAPREDRAQAAKAYRLAAERERDAAAATYIQLFSDWLVTRSVVRSKLAAYFPDEDFAGAWQEYADHITHYLRLGSSASTTALKGAYVELLAQFLGEDPAAWRVLVADPRLLAEEQYLDYVRADALLSDRLLTAKNDIVRRVLDSDVAGYSTDWDELLEDITPFYG